MLYIRKDGHYRRVTRRAFESQWQSLGYEIVENESRPKPKAKPKAKKADS